MHSSVPAPSHQKRALPWRPILEQGASIAPTNESAGQLVSFRKSIKLCDPKSLMLVAAISAPTSLVVVGPNGIVMREDQHNRQQWARESRPKG